jgi:hypothetical protein
MKTLAAAIALYFFTFLVEGPLRYYLALANLETALYARDGILLCGIALAMCRHLRRPVSLYVPGLLLLIAFHSLTGVLFTEQPMQVAFGLKMLLPFVLGVVIVKWVRLEAKALQAVVLVFFSVCVIGIFLNDFYTFDWEGFVYRVGETNVQGAVRWWHSGGQKRLAGFARSSYDAAIQVLVCAMFLAVYLRPVMLRLMVWVITGIAIGLTTTKGALVAYAALTIFFGLRGCVSKNGEQWLLRAIGFPAGIMILLPVYSGIVDVQLDFDSPVERFLLGSYAERMETVWPKAFENLDQAGSFIIGRGIGGVGTPQLYFEPGLWNFADNLFVFVFSTCGIFSLFYFFFLLWQAQKLELRRPSNALTYAILMFCFVYGITTAVLENGVIAFVLGLATGQLIESYLARPEKQRGLEAAPGVMQFNASAFNQDARNGHT